MKNNKNEYLKIKIKDLVVPILIKRYRTSKGIKLLGRGDNLRVTVPMHLAWKRIGEILEPYHEKIYYQYLVGIDKERNEKSRKENLEITIYLEGIPKEIVYIERSIQDFASTFQEGKVRVCIEKDKMIYQHIREELVMLVYNIAKEILPLAFKENLKLFNFKREPILVIKKMRSQWGNCKKKESRITLNTHLIELPPSLRDFVIIHELAHLIEANHGKDFYKIIDNFYPNRKILESELKKWSFVLKDNFIEEYSG